ncbi:MAG: DEAD/DEAH box helicase, partial [Oscillospiraceae bacterium]|nr:DEAD/DEAH box helicase [Oscillospiraceae bacterium]
MKQLGRLLEQHPVFCQLTAAIKTGRTPVTMSGMAECHKSHFSASLADCLERPVMVIVQDEATALRMAKDMSVLGSAPVLNYPSRDFVLLGMDGASAEYEHQRLKVLSTLLNGQPCIVTASVEAVSQLTLPPEKLRSRELSIDFDHSYQLDSLLGDLVAMGYERREQIEGTCQFACRGGILDIFPPNYENPIRIEFWDEDVDSINTFKVDTQRREDPLDSVIVPPAREVLFDSHDALKKLLLKASQTLKGKSGVKAKEHLEQDIRRLEDGINPVSIDRYLPLLYPQPATIFDYMPQAVTVLCEPITCKERLKSVLDQHHEDVRQLLEEGVLFKDCSVFYDDFVSLCRNLSSHSGVLMDSFTRMVTEVPVKESLILSASQMAAWSGEYEVLKEDLTDYCRDGYCCVLFAGTQRSAEALCADLLRDGFNAAFVSDVPQLIAGKVYVLEDSISGGIEYPKLRLAILSHGRSGQNKQRKAKKKSNIKQISDLNIGDYVVHVSHGIGIFEGVVKREIHGVIKDYIQIRYAGTDMLFVPVTQLDLVTKYVSGGEEGLVKLNKLNSGEWQKTRARVKKEVKDMADELIKLYAQRLSVEGHAFSRDTEWQHDFERRFPYEETDDQLRCIQEIKDDMERSAPMDRLLCGDVGFGKTEVAIRAAFKAVMDGKQVAVLVPTTILAWQHFQTFKSRMEGFPIKVDLLSRFRNARDSEQV